MAASSRIEAPEAEWITGGDPRPRGLEKAGDDGDEPVAGAPDVIVVAVPPVVSVECDPQQRRRVPSGNRCKSGDAVDDDAAEGPPPLATARPALKQTIASTVATIRFWARRQLRRIGVT